MTDDGLSSCSASTLVTLLWGRQVANINELESAAFNFEIVYLFHVKKGTEIR